ncbi:MAG: response regulator [Bacteroidota bacterium]
MKKILYVDDESFNLEVFIDIFKGIFEVYTANSGIAALSILNQEQIDFVITDMKMPNMSGLKLVEEIREKSILIPCYILTGYELKKEVKQAIDKGDLNGYFAKPFDTEEVLKTIRSF